jgi:hypothetical protein
VYIKSNQFSSHFQKEEKQKIIFFQLYCSITEGRVNRRIHRLQYRVCPPLASTHAVHLRRIELKSVRILCSGRLSHSSTAAVMSSWRFLGGGRRRAMAVFNWSHRCSIGEKSGEYGGQSSTVISLSCQECPGQSRKMWTGVVLLKIRISGY